MFSLLFDAISSSRIEHLMGFSDIYISNVEGAITASAELVDNAIVNQIHSTFSGGTGKLADSVQVGANTIALAIGGTGSVDVSIEEPYADRLEFGFNATDSLGRSYNQPPYEYAQPAIDSVSGECDALYEAAVLAAWNGL